MSRLPPYPFPVASKATVFGFPSKTPTKKARSSLPSFILNRVVRGSLVHPFMICRMAGPLTNLICWYSMRSWVPALTPASMPPEMAPKRVTTTNSFNISRMSLAPSQSSWPYLVKKRVRDVEKEDGKHHTVRKATDVANQNRHHPCACPIDQHGDEIDRRRGILGDQEKRSDQGVAC